MANIKFTNFARTALAVGVGSGDVTMSVTGGTGALFPALTAGQYFYATLENATLDREIVKVTARTTDTFTVTRGQDGTTARAWVAGDIVSLRLNAAAITDAVVGTLLAANNLSDVGSAAVARTNLGAQAAGSYAASGANADITSLASPAIAAATATTQAATDSTTKVATTAFVRQFKQLAQIIASSTGAYSTSTGVIPADNTIPQNTEGTQVLTASITPTNASSTLEVCVTVYMTNAGVAFIGAALFRDAGVGAVASGLTYSAAGNALYPITFTYLVSAGSTAATTFNVRCGSTSGGWYLNGNSVGQLWGGVLSSSITIKEYLP